MSSFKVLSPTNEQFSSPGPAWVLRNSKNIMYALVLAAIVALIITSLYMNGSLVYKKSQEAPKTALKSILKTPPATSKPPPSKPKSDSSHNSHNSKDDLEKDIDEINESQK